MKIQVSHFYVAELGDPRLELRRTVKAFELAIRFAGETIGAPDRSIWAHLHGIRVDAETGGPPSISLGMARPTVPVKLTQDGTSHFINAEFFLPIQPSQVHGLEDLRDGGDLRLQLAFAGEGGSTSVAGSLFPIADVFALTVPRSQWIEQLRQARALDIVLLEVPMPLVEPTPQMAAVAKHLRQAQHLFAEAHYSAAVLNCRMALEALGEVEQRHEKWGAQALDRLGAPRRSEMTKEEREVAAQAGLHFYCHPSAHAGEYSRSEAKLAIALCSAFIAKAFSA